MSNTSDEIAAESALLDFYSDRAVAFGGFFIAAIFGILTVPALAQGINSTNKIWEGILVILSLAVYIAFSYGGYIVLRGFFSYAKIADKIEGGQGDKRSLRAIAKIDKGVQNIITSEDKKRKAMFGKKKILNNFESVKKAYVILLFATAVFSYSSQFESIILTI
jgi:hypothetical protein